jgi:hypothetical protein
MTIKYSDGRKIEGIILSRGDGDRAMRVALKGVEEAVDFVFIAGTWVLENGEPVEIEFAWEQHRRSPTVSEDDCVCSKDLAARLIRLLLNGSETTPLAVDVIPPVQPLNDCRVAWIV